MIVETVRGPWTSSMETWRSESIKLAPSSPLAWAMNNPIAWSWRHRCTSWGKTYIDKYEQCHWRVSKEQQSVQHNDDKSEICFLSQCLEHCFEAKVSNWTNICMRQRCFCSIQRAPRARGLLMWRPDSENKKKDQFYNLRHRNPFRTDCYCFDVHLQPFLVF